MQLPPLLSSVGVFLGLRPVLLLLRGSHAAVVVVDMIAVGNVGNTRGFNPDIGVLGHGGVDVEGVDLFKSHTSTRRVFRERTLRTVARNTDGVRCAGGKGDIPRSVA